MQILEFRGRRERKMKVANPWNSPGQNTAVGNLSLLQWIFLIQESNRSPLHCMQVESLPTELLGKPQRGMGCKVKFWT